MHFEDKPATPEQALAHYGVQGMKWGVRKKKYTTAEIHEARYRQKKRNRELDNMIDDAWDSGTPAKERQKIVKNFEKKRVAARAHEDRAIAARATKGEKIAHVLLAGPAALITLPAQKGYEKYVEKSVDRNRKRAAKL